VEELAAKAAEYINVNLIKNLDGRLLYGDESVHVRHYATDTWMNGGLGVAPHILKLSVKFS